MSKKKSSLTKFYRRWRTRRGTQSHSSCSEPLPFSPPLRGFPSCRMVLEPRILLDASLVDTTSIEADPEQPTDLQFDVPGTRVSDPRVLDPRLSDPQDLQRMITPDLPTIRNWLDTANTHNARLSIVVKLWDAQPEDRISLADTYSSSSVLRDTWDGARGELRLELKEGVALPTQDVGEAFLDALKAVQLEASGAEDVSTREVWVFPDACGCNRGCVPRREKLGHGSALCARRLPGELCGCAQDGRAAALFRRRWVSGTFFLGCGEVRVRDDGARTLLMAGSVGQGQRRGLEGVERSEGRAGFLAGDRCRRRNIRPWCAEFRLTGFRFAGFRLAGLRLGRCGLGEVLGNERLPTKSVFGFGFSCCLLGRG